MWDDERDLEGDQKGRIPTFAMLRKIHPYVKEHLSLFALAFLLALVGVSMILAQPVIFKRIVDVDFPSGDLSSLMRSSLIYLGLMVGGALSTGLATILLGRTGVEVVNRIKQDLFARLLSLGLPWVEKQSVGSLVSRIESDAQRLVNLTSTMSMRMLSALCMIVGAVVVIATTDLRLFYIASTFLPLMLLGTLVLFHHMRTRFREERRLYAEITGEVAELAPATRLLQALGRGDWATARLAAKSRIYKSFTLRLMFMEYGFWTGLGFIEIVMTALALWLGGGWIADGTLSAGSLVMFAQYAAMIYWPVVELSEQLAEIQRAGGAADRIFELLEKPDELPRPEHPVVVPSEPQALVLKDISFAYDEEKWILKDFSCRVEPGETLAIVGPTGGGKSTLLSLACRLRDPQKGQVLLGDQDVRDFDPQAYRRLFGLVMQDLYLFPDSIAENVRVFREGISLDRVKEAARVAGIEKEILSREKGYDGVLAERGADLSYGQRQLMALARALAVDPPFLILDEATSSVDPRTELRIQETLNRLTKGRTVLIVAHRLSTIRHADRILVIQDGAIVEQWHHDELKAAGGVYAELLRSQDVISIETNGDEEKSA
jgi:ATP-binding cassette, subfamily B, multidrug efflux pump